jgi:hypothetical protein
MKDAAREIICGISSHEIAGHGTPHIIPAAKSATTSETSLTEF